MLYLAVLFCWPYFHSFSKSFILKLVNHFVSFIHLSHFTSILQHWESKSSVLLFVDLLMSLLFHIFLRSVNAFYLLLIYCFSTISPNPPSSVASVASTYMNSSTPSIFFFYIDFKYLSLHLSSYILLLKNGSGFNVTIFKCAFPWRGAS